MSEYDGQPDAKVMADHAIIGWAAYELNSRYPEIEPRASLIAQSVVLSADYIYTETGSIDFVPTPDPGTRGPYDTYLWMAGELIGNFDAIYHGIGQSLRPVVARLEKEGTATFDDLNAYADIVTRLEAQEKARMTTRWAGYTEMRQISQLQIQILCKRFIDESHLHFRDQRLVIGQAATKLFQTSA